MQRYLSLVKFAHTVFALPFALVGFVMAIRLPGFSFQWEILLLVLGCMVFARSAAMAFNRYADRHIDARNSRTAVREIPAGKVSSTSALVFVLINAALFMACAWLINPLCFALSPVALVIILGYSYTKRFTWLCHFVLGLGLALAPVGAYLTVTGEFALLPIMLGGVVFFWVSGFDIIYAMQDRSFDLEENLSSVPVRFGPVKAMRISTVLHLCCGVLLLVTSYLMVQQYPDLWIWHWLGIGVFLSLLIYQHTIVSSRDLSRVNLAFFTTNGIASVIFGVLLIVDFYV